MLEILLRARAASTSKISWEKAGMQHSSSARSRAVWEVLHRNRTALEEQQERRNKNQEVFTAGND